MSRKHSNRTNIEPESLLRLPPPSRYISRATTSAHISDYRLTSA
jgi:hypothetical protein